MISFHFDVDKVEDFDDACAANAATFKKVFHACLDNGVYLAPSAFETLFIAHSHTYEQLDATIEAIAKGL
jgi:glutamate-1-semialdehyde 2,1-aminomutase